MALPRPRLPLLQGSLDLLVLSSLSGGQSHGFAVANFIRTRSGGTLQVEDAALYQALHRLEGRGLVSAEWGVSENNRRARFYELTTAGRKRLGEEVTNWRLYARAVSAVVQGV
jgi:PadR family transcriptional regulator PadR